MRIIKFLSIVVSIFLCTNTLATNYQWNGSQNTVWTNSLNWTPNGVPSTTDSVKIVTTSNHPQMQSDVTIKRLTMTSGTLNLNSYTLYVTNESRYPGGTITNGTLNLRGTSVYFEGSTVDCTVDAILGYIYFNGSVFNQTSSFEQTGVTSGLGTGGNTFNADVTIKNSSTAYLRLGNNNPDVFNGTTTFKNTGGYTIQVGFNALATFNGNVIVENSGGGIAFGAGSASGAAILSTGKTITIGSGGFTAGTLSLKSFTQQGNTAQQLTATGTAIVNLISSTFNGATVITSPGVLSKTSTFNSSFELIKTGTSSNFSDGGNTFNGSTIIRNNASNSASIRLALQTGDVFNSNVDFITTTGNIQIAYAGTTEFKGNISLNSSLAYFNVGSGTVKFAGSANQQLNGTINYLFNKVEVNKSAGNVTLNSTASIDTSLNLVNGIINTTSSNLLTLKASSTTSGGSNTSFISGPIRKIGNTVYSFPVGKNNVIRRFEIGTLSASNESIIVEYFPSTPTNFATIDTSLNHINRCEYWSVSHPVGSSSFSAKCSWDSRSCDIAVNGIMVITSWDGTKWKNLGASSLTGDVLVGSLSSNVSSNNISYTTAIIKNSINDSVVKPNLLSEFAIFAADSIISSEKIYSLGKVASSWVDTSLIYSNDSIITNYNGSSTSQLQKILTLTSQIASLKDTVFNPFSSSSSISPKYYNINGNVVLNNIFTFTDTTSLYIFKISGKLILSDSGCVISNSNNLKNIIWQVDTIEVEGQNGISGIILSKSNIVINNSLSGDFSLFSFKNIKIENYNNISQFVANSNPVLQNVTTIPCPPLAPLVCNFVRNPGFADARIAPTVLGNVRFNQNNSDPCSWYSPVNNISSPDYFSQLAPTNFPIMSVPTQVYNASNPTIISTQADNNLYAGNDGYCMIGATTGLSTAQREYISTNLIQPLTPGVTYYGEFYVSLNDLAAQSISSLGMDIENNLPPTPIPLDIIIPEVSNNITIQLNDKVNWTRISGCFTVPTAGYQIITIGNFNSDANSNILPETSILPNPPISAYYIDDVSIVPFSINAGNDVVIQSCGGTSMLGIDNCLSALDQGQLVYTWTLVSGSSSVSTLSSTSILHPTITNNNFTANIANVTYRLTVTSTTQGGCVTFDDVLITLNPCCNITSSISTTPTCSNTGTCTITRTGGTGTINYVISPGNITGSFTTPTFTISNLISGTYSILLTDANGCTSSNNFTIASIAVPTLNITGAIYECSANDEYYVSNPILGNNYSFSVTSSVGTFSNIGNTAVITSALVNSSTFTITFFDNTTSCPVSNSLTVYACCVGDINVANNQTLTFTDISVTQLGGLGLGNRLSTLPGFSTGSALSATPFGAAPRGTIAINGTLTVDDNFMLYNTNILMGPMARIVVNPGMRLILNDQVYMHACGEYMWDGIYLQDLSLLKSNPGGITVIEDALNAVVANGRSHFQLNRTLFNKNWISIQVNQSFFKKRSCIFNCTFTSAGNVIDANFNVIPNLVYAPISLLPRIGRRSTIGIQLTNVTDTDPQLPGINIGTVDFYDEIGFGNDDNQFAYQIACNSIDNNAPLNDCNPNTFSNLDFGIQAFSSDVKIVNNIFRDINNSSNSSSGDNNNCFGCQDQSVGTCISLNARRRLNNNLEVGEFVLGRNTGENVAMNIFQRCKRGIFTQGSVNSTITYNQFDVITFAASQHRAANDNLIRIDHNDFITCNRGVQINNSFALNTNQSANPFNISDNVYDYSGSFQITGPGGLRKWFVNIENAPSILPTSFIVRDNSILQPYTGVRTSLVGGRGILAQINNNVIGLPVSTPSQPYYGIRIIGSGQVRVLENSIGKQGGDPTVTRPFGISIETSDDLTLNSNTMYKTGTGIRAFNSILPSVLQCNYMDRNWQGISFVNSNLGNQGSSTQPSDNQWVGILNRSVNGLGFVPQSVWWSREVNFTTSFSTNNQFPVNPTSWPISFNQVGSPIPDITCTYPCVGNPGCRNSYFEEVITEQGNFTNLNTEDKYLSKMIVYSAMESDSSIYMAGLPTDSLFESFYDSMKFANAGKIIEIQNLLAQNDYVSADAINNSITPENNSETNQKVINEVYAATWAREIYEFTPSQYNQLFDISNQNPIYGGLAVYAARVMLDLDIYDSIPEIGNRIIGTIENNNNVESSSGSNKLELFPNPATNLVTLKFKNGKFLNGDICIKNLLGSIVISQKAINTGNSSIAISNLPNGVYFLTFTDEFKKVFQLKFVKT